MSGELLCKWDVDSRLFFLSLIFFTPSFCIPPSSFVTNSSFAAPESLIEGTPPSELPKDRTKEADFFNFDFRNRLFFFWGSTLDSVVVFVSTGDTSDSLEFERVSCPACNNKLVIHFFPFSRDRNQCHTLCLESGFYISPFFYAKVRYSSHLVTADFKFIPNHDEK